MIDSHQLPEQLAYVQLAYAAGAMILSAIAGKLLAKKQTNPLDGSNPTTLSSRGSYTNYVIGPEQVEPAFCWWGEREVRMEASSQGGKGLGNSAPDQAVFFESGWHMLATNGPMWSLDWIDQGGEIIFQGPITRDSHPSGSTVDLGHEGSFTIFWGEPNQPANTFLGNAARVGITSRWPFGCYVVWNKKRLGSSAGTWPILKYRLTKHTGSTLLSGTPGFIEPTQVLSGATETIAGHLNGGEGFGYFAFADDVTSIFYAGLPVHLAGNSMPDGDYTVLRSVSSQVITVPEDDSDPNNIIPAQSVTVTQVFLYGGVSGANNSGTLQAYTLADNGGVNPAHAIAEILFEQTPQGLGLDPTYMPWNVSALEALGVQMATDRIVSSWIATQGGNADALLAGGLLDMGVMVPMNYVDGSIDFVMVREPTGTLPHVTQDSEAETLPEIDTIHFDPAQKDRVIFKFADRSRRFTDNTIGVDEDGRASLENFANGNEVNIEITTEYAAASKIAERRNQEVLAGNSQITLKGNRMSRLLRPGDAITADGYEDVLRVSQSEFDPLSGIVTLSCMTDFYGVPASNFQNTQGGGIVTNQPATADLQFAFIEVPEVMLQGDPMTILLLRIRAHNQVTGANVYLSRDNATYTYNSTSANAQAGGTLNSGLSASTKGDLAIGPSFTALGPDIDTVIDLTGDDTNWRLGRQIAVIKSSAGVEICFVKTVTHIGGSTYRLDGLLRGRFDTKKLGHPSGAQVYIFQQTAVTGIQDLLLVPNDVLYLKSQPTTFSGIVPLDSISPFGAQLYGKGKKPMALTYLTVVAPALGSPSYATGQDVRLRWGYRSAQQLTSGAGQQSAGTPTGPQIPRGSFILEFLTTGDVLKRTESVVATNQFLYTNADIITDFGSEVDFHVRVSQIDAGLQTPKLLLTVSKV